MKKVVLIDDDEVFLKLTAKYLKKKGYDAVGFPDWQEAWDLITRDKVDIVLVDLHLHGINGIQVTEKIKQAAPDIPILMITAHSSINTAIDAVKAGADDYIQKPCDNSEIFFKITRTLENSEKNSELKSLKETLEGHFSFNHLYTKDEDTKKVYQQARTVADLDILVYINGDTGIGKEVLAKNIHSSGNRSAKPFVVFNCAAINENLVESELFGHVKGSFTSAYADKKGLCETVEDGTLFIDEIGELSLAVQKKLLRILQEKEFESIGSTQLKKFKGRIIAASHRNLKELIKKGEFREDLFFRLNVFPLYLKPLRERKVDIMDLAQTFLKMYSRKYDKQITGFSAKSVELIMAYGWPGNIRELEHFIERQVLISKKEVIDIKDQKVFQGSGLSEQLEVLDEEVIDYADFMKQKEKMYLENLLKKAQGSMEKASALAGFHRKTLYMKLKEHDLDKNNFKK